MPGKIDGNVTREKGDDSRRRIQERKNCGGKERMRTKLVNREYKKNGSMNEEEARVSVALKGDENRGMGEETWG